jgi:hypothetical protein
VISRAVYDQLAAEYQARLGRLDEEIAALHGREPELERLEVAEARRFALLAAKSALRDSERAGQLSADDLAPLFERIDQELTALDPDRSAKP